MDALQQLTKFGVARSGNTFLFAASAIGSSTVSLVGNALVSGSFAVGTNSNLNAPLELHGTPTNWGTMRITPLITGNESSLAFSRTATGLMASPGDAWSIGQGIGGNGGGTLSITSYVPGSTYLNAVNILPSGAVGIGKLPGAMLDIAGDTNIVGNLMAGSQLSLLGGTSNCILSLFSSGVRPGTASTSFYGWGVGNDVIRHQGASLTSVHAFCGSNTEFARVTSLGIGILQPNPVYALDVTGSARFAIDVYKAYSYNLTTAVSGAGAPNLVKRICSISYATDASVFAEITMLVKGFNIHMARRFQIPLRNSNDTAYQTIAPFFGDDSLGTGNECQVLIQNTNFTSSVIALRWTLVSATSTRTPTFDVSVRITGSNSGITDDLTIAAVDTTAYAQCALTPLTISNGTVNTTALTTASLTGTYASLTQINASTITVNSLASSNSSITTAYTSTLTVGTILNFSAGGSLGTNLYLSGTLTSPVASITSLTCAISSITTQNVSTLTAASLSAGLAFTSTLTVGTILNFSAGGSLGTNLYLSGTLTSPVASITSLTCNASSISNLVVGGNASITGLMVNNVTGFLQARAFDDTATYAIIAGTVGQALPPAGLGRVAAASQTSSLNLFGAVFGTLTSSYSVRMNGYMQATQTGTYSFQATYRDGLTFWIGSTKLVDSWKYLSGTASSISSMVLYNGVWAPVAIEHATASTNEKLLIQWAINGGTTLSTLAHGIGFNLAYEFAELPPVTLGNTYVSGQVYANDVVNMAAGASLQGSQYFSGYLSQLTNDAGYVATLGSTLTGTALLINGPYATITNTLAAGTVIAGSVTASLGSISTLNVGTVIAGSMTAGLGSISTLLAGSAKVVGTVLAQSILGQASTQAANDSLYLGPAGGNFFLDRSAGSGNAFVFGYNTPLSASNTASFQIYNGSSNRVTLFGINSAGSSSGSNYVFAQPSLMIGQNAAPAYTLDVSGNARITGSVGVGTAPSPATGYPSGVVMTVGNGTNCLNLVSAYSAATVSHIEAFNAGNSTKNAICLNAYGGNIGINTTTPAYSLDVSGSTRITGTLTTNNLALPVTSVFTGYTSQLNNNSSGNSASPYTFSSPNGNISINMQASGGGGYTNYINMYQYNGQGGPGAQIVGQDNGAASANLLFFTSGSQRMSIAAGGAVSIAGALSKGSGSFQIRHPFRKDCDLLHSFIEGPRCDLIYRGQKRLNGGTAQVDLDAECTGNGQGMTCGTFQALCRDPQVWISNNENWDPVKGRVSGKTLTIESSCIHSNALCDWMVVAERQDDVIREWDKTDANGQLILEHLSTQF